MKTSRYPSTSSSETPVVIGKLGAPHGLGGELKLHQYSGERERLLGVSSLYVGNVLREVESLKLSAKTPLIKFRGSDTREAAEALMGSEVSASLSMLAPLDDDAYYVSELIGMDVYGEVSGGRKLIGQVCEIINNPANDILVIRSPERGEILLPFVDAFVREVDTEARTIEVDLPDGAGGDES